MKEIKLFFRRKQEDQYSIENVYNSVLNEVCQEFEIDEVVMPCRSKGIFRRLANIIYAILKSGTINHTTGDVHYISIFLKKSRNVLTIHDIYPLLTTKGLKRAIIKILWFDLPIYRSSRIITVSDFSKKELVEKLGVSAKRITVIHNCVASYFSYSKKTNISSKPIILHIGTKENKNLLNLVCALQEFECQLFIVGCPDATSQEKLDQLNIDYKVHTDVSNYELNVLYRKCDMLSFVSTYEGFGMPIIEAQVTGRAVLTSNCSSMPEVAGKGALLVSPHSIAEIRQGVEKILKNELYRRKLIELGRENAKRFDSKKIGKQYLALYKKVYEEVEV